MQNEQFMTILEHIPAAIFFFDIKGIIVYINGMARGLLDVSYGYDTPIFQQEPICSSPLCFKIQKLLLEKQGFSDVLWQYERQFYSVDGIPISDGAMIVMHDISERMAAEGALRDQEEKYRLLAESAPIGIVMVQDDLCVFANNLFGVMTGFGSHIIGKPFSDLVHTGDLPKLQALLSPEMQPELPHSLRLITKDENTVWTECSVSPVTFEGREAMLVNVMNVTNQKHMEEQLHLSKQEIARIADREKRFVEDISHYFFNPLCIAKGYIDLSMQDADPILRRNLEITRDAVDRVETVVKHVVMEGRIYE